jgi:hypothetical protein
MAFALSFKPHGSFSATEARTLIVHKGSLFCGTGQWCAINKGVGPQMIRQDSSGGEWRLEQTFSPQPPGDVNRIAISCVSELHFPTANLTTLVCGFFGGSAVAVKNAAGQWRVTRVGDGRGEIHATWTEMTANPDPGKSQSGLTAIQEG